MNLTPGPPRQAPAEIIMLQLPQGLGFGHLLDISGRAADRLDAEGWLLTEERREEIRAAAYQAGLDAAAEAVWAKATELRGKPFRGGEVGIENVYDMEAASEIARAGTP